MPTNNPPTNILSDDLPELLRGDLRTVLRNVISRNNTGYTYDKLKEAINTGEDLLEDDEIEQVDGTVNLLLHYLVAHIKSTNQQLLSDIRAKMPEMREEKLHAGYEFSQTGKEFNEAITAVNLILTEIEGGRNE